MSEGFSEVFYIGMDRSFKKSATIIVVEYVYSWDLNFHLPVEGGGFLDFRIYFLLGPNVKRTIDEERRRETEDVIGIKVLSHLLFRGKRDRLESSSQHHSSLSLVYILRPRYPLFMSSRCLGYF